MEFSRGEKGCPRWREWREQKQGGEGDCGQGELQVHGPSQSVGDDVGEENGDHILMNFVC